MDNKKQIRAKALELAILAIGPLTAEDRNRLRKDYRNAPILLGEYAPLVEVIIEYLDEMSAGHTKPTFVPKPSV